MKTMVVENPLHRTAGASAGAAAAPTTGHGSCPLVLGEAVQGRLYHGPHFLITAPIQRSSWASFEPDPHAGLVVEPADRTKSLAAVSRYLAGEGLPMGGRLRISTPLQPAQGFGTSTADIAASLRAAAAAWGRTVSPEAISRFAADLEPTDGSMYDGSVAYAHRIGALLERLGSPPPFEALVVCVGEGVDTVAFDNFRKDFQYPLRDQDRLFAAWAMVRQANRRQRVGLLGRACTISARVNQQLLPKPLFAQLARYAELGGAEGVVVAHTGTIQALMLDPARPDHGLRKARAYAFLESLAPGCAFEVESRHAAPPRAARTTAFEHLPSPTMSRAQEP
jgi:uncharacterized protein involved in propanediol utilization